MRCTSVISEKNIAAIGGYSRSALGTPGALIVANRTRGSNFADTLNQGNINPCCSRILKFSSTV